MSFLSTGLGAIGLASGAGAPVTAAVSVLPNLFHSSAAGPNHDAAQAVWSQEIKNSRGVNLAAVAAFITRNNIQTQTSKAPWADGLAQIPQAIQDAARKAIPQLNDGYDGWSTFGAIAPEQVLPTVQRLAVYVDPGTITGSGPTGSSVLDQAKDVLNTAANAVTQAVAGKTGVNDAVTAGGQQAAVSTLVKVGLVLASVGLVLGVGYFAATAHRGAR